MSDKTGLFCFQNDARPCAADCAAFIDAPDHADYKDQQWARCLVLVNQHRTGKHLTMIANSLENLIQIRRKSDADRARTNQAPIPPVK